MKRRREVILPVNPSSHCYWTNDFTTMNASYIYESEMNCKDKCIIPLFLKNKRINRGKELYSKKIKSYVWQVYRIFKYNFLALLRKKIVRSRTIRLYNRKYNYIAKRSFRENNNGQGNWPHENRLIRFQFKQ